MTEPITRDDVTRWSRDLYEWYVDKKDAAGFAAAFTSNARLRFGNNDPLVGRDAIRDGIAQFFTAFVSLSHESKGMLVDGDTVVLEALVTYTRHDGRRVTVPAVTIFHLAGREKGKPVADDCRIYVDLTPLFAPSA